MGCLCPDNSEENKGVKRPGTLTLDTKLMPSDSEIDGTFKCCFKPYLDS